MRLPEGGEGMPSSAASCQRAEMLTHHTLEMLKRRTGLTRMRCVRLIAFWYQLISEASMAMRIASEV